MSVKTGIPDLESLIGQLEANGSGPDDRLLQELSEALGSMLGVRWDEVAVMHITPDRSSLKFLLPIALRKVGSVPLKVEGVRPLAVQSILERRPEVVNDFAARPHARVFEGVPVASSTMVPIQKIISCPVFCEQMVIGVVQISRKGTNASAAGPDFTASDLHRLQQLNNLLAQTITACSRAGSAKQLSEAELTKIASNKRRRTTRVTVNIPVEVILKGSKQNIVVEQTQTLVVNAYGACVVLKAVPEVGQTVILINRKTRVEMFCDVLNVRLIPKSTNYEVGLAFKEPNTFFWQINFPPEDWDPAVRKTAWAPGNKA